MTSKNNRAKKDARTRQKATGERYTASRRKTRAISRRFIDDHCASCLQPLPDGEPKLYCSELCSQTADTVRYWRATLRDGRYEADSTVREAIDLRVAHLLAGGYHRQARALTPELRELVFARDEGKCVACGKPGEEIDHIDGDSSDLANLQLLCKDCHHAKTGQQMVLAPPDKQQWVWELYATRVAPAEPSLLADDEVRWRREWAGLKKARRQRLLEKMEEAGLDLADFKGASRAEMVEALNDELADADEGAYPEEHGDYFDRVGDDYDGGYGPGSYFAHAMAKDD